MAFKNMDVRYGHLGRITRDGTNIIHLVDWTMDNTVAMGDRMKVSPITNTVVQSHFPSDDPSASVPKNLQPLLQDFLAIVQNKQPIDVSEPNPRNTRLMSRILDAASNDRDVSTFSHGTGWAMMTGASPKEGQTGAVVNRKTTDNAVHCINVSSEGIIICGTQALGNTTVDLDMTVKADWGYYLEFNGTGNAKVQGPITFYDDLTLNDITQILRTSYPSGRNTPSAILKDTDVGALRAFLPIYEGAGDGFNGKIRIFGAGVRGLVITQNAYWNESTAAWYPDLEGIEAWRYSFSPQGLRYGFVQSAGTNWLESSWAVDGEFTMALPSSSPSGYKCAFTDFDGDLWVDRAHYALCVENQSGGDDIKIARDAITFHGRLNHLDGASDITLTAEVESNVATKAVFDVTMYGATIYAQSPTISDTTIMTATGLATFQAVT
jgi:hypothetical protein